MSCPPFRSPKTLQEIRENMAIRLDPEIMKISELTVRAKRINLPTAWDDIPHSTKYMDNSWKRHRKTQFYEVCLL